MELQRDGAAGRDARRDVQADAASRRHDHAGRAGVHAVHVERGDAGVGSSRVGELRGRDHRSADLRLRGCGQERRKHRRSQPGFGEGAGKHASAAVRVAHLHVVHAGGQVGGHHPVDHVGFAGLPQVVHVREQDSADADFELRGHLPGAAQVLHAANTVAGARDPDAHRLALVGPCRNDRFRLRARTGVQLRATGGAEQGQQCGASGDAHGISSR